MVAGTGAARETGGAGACGREATLTEPPNRDPTHDAQSSSARKPAGSPNLRPILADAPTAMPASLSGRILAAVRAHDVPQPLAATLFMLAAMGFFVSMGVFIRYAAEQIHTLEVVFFRNFFALLILSPLILRSGGAILKTANLKLHLLRGGLNVVGMVAGFTALTMIPLAEATALGFAAPLFATIGAIFILGEVVRARRMAALAAGFTGVLVVLGPSLGGISVGAMLALTNAMLLAVVALIVKRLTKTDSVETIIIYMVLLPTPVSLIPALFVWTWPDLMTLFWLVCLAGAGTIGHYCWTRASSLAELSLLQPLEFAKLPLTALAGFLIFSEMPGITVWIGGAIIFASTAYITRRESMLARAAREKEKARETGSE
jgi:drug/metabolite transporter (DMT)-like permease